MHKLQDQNPQMWSRGYKAKNTKKPRPRTALPRTDPREAKDRNARGQGQGHRRKSSAKKLLGMQLYILDIIEAILGMHL